MDSGVLKYPESCPRSEFRKFIVFSAAKRGCGELDKPCGAVRSVRIQKSAQILLNCLRVGIAACPDYGPECAAESGSAVHDGLDAAVDNFADGPRGPRVVELLAHCGVFTPQSLELAFRGLCGLWFRGLVGFALTLAQPALERCRVYTRKVRL